MINEYLAPDNKGEETERLGLDLQRRVPILVDGVSIYLLHSILFLGDFSLG